jgi:hypothetical protein
LTETPQAKGKPTFVAQTYVPLFAKLTRAGFAEPFGYLAFAPLGLAGTEAWLQENRERVDQLTAWLEVN